MTSNLSLTQKFTALLALFAAITVSVLFLLVSSMNEPINFGTKEADGDTYQRPVEAALQNIMLHRIYAQRALYGDHTGDGQLAELEKKIQSSLSEIEKVNSELGETLQFTDQGLSSRKRDHFTIKNVAKEWADLNSAYMSLKPTESNDRHAHIVGDLRTMITHLGDTSNLILDPDLDSYYLMDITLLALPQTQDRIQNAIVEFEPIFRRGSASLEERIRLKVVVSMMTESDLERIKGDFTTVLNEDPNFNGALATLTTQMTPSHNKYAEQHKALITMLDNAANGEIASASHFVETSENALNASFDYWGVAVNELDEMLNARISSMQHAKVIYSLVSLLCLVISLGIAFFFIRYLVRNMRGFVSVLTHSSEELSNSSNQSASSATMLSEASTEQASSLQETMASIEEISAMVSQNAESANSTKKAVDANQKVSEDGSRSVDDMLSAIDDIKKTNTEILSQLELSNKEFAEIVKIISEIGEKTNVINEIVFQTKLLSFNASVEAARAGEHGKGFAVVAEEVGNLAQMSGNAAKEITDMLAGSIKKVNEIVQGTSARVDHLVEVGKDKIAVGHVTAQKCREVLTKITENARQMAVMIDGIAHASKEQAQGVDEINKAISQLDQVTHQNSSVAQQSSQQADQLNSQAASLTEAVHDLVLFVDGAKSQNVSEAAQTTRTVVSIDEARKKRPVLTSFEMSNHSTEK